MQEPNELGWGFRDVIRLVYLGYVGPTLLMVHADIKVVLLNPRAPSYLNSRLLGYVALRYIELSSHYLSNWEP